MKNGVDESEKSKLHEYVEKMKQGFDWQAGVKWTDDTGVLQRGEVRLMQKTCTQRKKCKCKIMNAPSRMSKAGKRCTLQERLKWCVGMGGGL